MNMRLVVLLLVTAASASAQQTRSLGAGFVLGNPTGLTAKYHADPRLAFDLGLGFSGDFALYGSALLHVWDIVPQPPQGKLGLYIGAGPRLELENDPEFGIRTPLGAAYWLPKHPVELFLELAPVFQLTPGDRVQLDAGLGVRVYFGRRAPKS